MTAMQLNKAAYRACANANNSRTIGCTHKVKAGQAAGAVPGVACSESRSAHSDMWSSRQKAPPASCLQT